MRASLVSSSGRAATRLCAACRKDAVAALQSRSAASRAAATIPLRRAFQTTAAAPVARTTAQRLPTETQYRSSPTSTSPASTTSAPPSPSMPTYYALFPETLPDGPPPSGKFHIDTRALRREFLRLQAASHPDFHHSASQTPSSPTPGEKEEENANNNTKSPARIRAEATSALINTAYKTLSSPLLRAQYLLREQHGVDLEGDEAGAHAGPDAELLMTVLEAREVIEEAQREEDLEEISAANEERIGECERRLAEALEAGDVEGAKEEAVRLRYWVNIREGIRGWERGKPVVLQH